MTTNWKKPNPPSKTKHPEVIIKVRNMAKTLGGVLFVSRRGVPIADVTVGPMRYSCTWFRKHKFWRVFYPFMDFTTVDQTKVDFKTDEKLVAYFEQLRKDCYK